MTNSSTSGTYQRGQAGQNAPRTIQQFTPLINKYTYKFHQRAVGLGCSMDEGDIRQELSIIFLRCVAAYDEAKGGSFMNYLISAMYHQMNQIMSKDQRNIERFKTVRQSQMTEEDEDSLGVWDRIDSGSASPEQNLEALQSMRHMLDRLSPQARLLVENVIEPNAEVCRQFDIQVRGTESVRRNGGATRAMRSLNTTFLLRLWGIPRFAGANLQKEIRAQAISSFVLEDK